MEIQLTQGKTAIIDDEDFDLIKGYSWYAKRLQKSSCVLWYARAASKEDSNIKVLMHRVILGATKGQITDHRDHDGLNNKRSNLRICTGAQNNYNRRVVGDYKGIFYRPDRHSWMVYCGKTYLGSYRDAEEAARVYDKAALERFGDFACVNFPNLPAGA